jgi:putative aldouronate transport system permease protein
MTTYFKGIPNSLEESAKLDGASDMQVLLRIFLPLSKPIFATMILFNAVSRWNSYLMPMLLLQEESKIPLQVHLVNLITMMQPREENVNIDEDVLSAETVTYATIVVSVIPMLIIYPFIQKHFTKGVMLGSLKG